MGNKQSVSSDQFPSLAGKHSKQANIDQIQDIQNLHDIFEQGKNIQSRSRKSASISNAKSNIGAQDRLESSKRSKASRLNHHTSNNTSLFIPMPQHTNPDHPSASYTGLLQKSQLMNAVSAQVSKKFASQMLITDLSTPLLKEVFRRNLAGVKREVESIQEGATKKFQHYELTVAFWMAIHLEYEEICNILLHKEPMLSKLVVAIQKKEQEQKMGIYSRKNSRKTYRSQKSGVEEMNESHLGGLNFPNTRFNAETLLQSSLKKDRPLNNEANQKKLDYSSLDQLLPTEMQVSTEVAAQMFSHFEFSITEEVLNNAIEKDQFDFILCLYVFGKNFLYNKKDSKSTQITFKLLFQMIKNHKSDNDEFKEIAKDICDWKLQLTVDNLLEALLQFQLDDLVIEYMGFYGCDLNERLLLFCIDVQNKKFLKNALMIRVFDKMIFREDSFVKLALSQLNDGTRSNYILDVLGLVDISIWKNRQLKALLEIFNEFAQENYEKNKLLLSYNPVLTISLSCEILHKIADCRKKFQNECFRISSQLLMLGQMYLSKIQDEKYYEKLILDEDFKNRSVLKIIIVNNFEKLMDEIDPKAENLMNKLWSGQEATNCDGNIYGYSSLSNLIMKPFKRINTGDQKQGLLTIASNNFEPNFTVDYSFQHRYRSRAISFYFMKEFLCAIVMLAIFQAITQKYLVISSDITFVEYTNEGEVGPFALRLLTSRIMTIDNSTNSTLDDSNSTETINSITTLPDIDAEEVNNPLKIIGYLFCFSLLFQWLLKVLFNIFSSQQVPFDKWTHLDTISAVLNFVAIQILNNSSTENISQPHVKDLFDYLMIVVLLVCWIRFLLYFLVIKSVSSMLLTLIEMVMDTLAFLFIVACFLIIMASIFTTLYQDVNSNQFGSLSVTFRTLFNAALATYTYGGMGGRTQSFSLLLDFFVFCANVLLLNFLISILSKTYDDMEQRSVFKYKQHLFKYCERYLLAFQDEVYGEIVLHPPPLSFFCLVLLPFIFNKEKLKQVAKSFSIAMFWLENILFLFIFFAYEVCILPFSFIKNFYNALFKSHLGPCNAIFVAIFWLFIGIPICLYFVVLDVNNLYQILSLTNGCKISSLSPIQQQQSQMSPQQLLDRDDKIDVNKQVQILNEARDSIILLYLALKKHFRNGKHNKSEKRRSNKSNNISSQHKQEDEHRQSLLSVPEKPVKGKIHQVQTGSPFGLAESRSPLHNQTKLTVQNSDQPETSSDDLSDDSDTDVKQFDITLELEFLQKHTGYNTNNSDCLYVVKKNLIVEDWSLRHKIYLQDKQGKTKGKDIDEEGGDLFAKKRSIRSQSLQVPQKKNGDPSAPFGKNEPIPASLFEPKANPAYKKLNDQIGEQVKANIKAARRATGVVVLDDLLNAGQQKKQILIQRLVAIPEATEKNIVGGYEKSKTQVRNKENNEVYSMQINPSEMAFINSFFSNFVIVSEQSLEEQHIDIVLFLRALPHRITSENLYQVKLFNFKICQESLIAYQNLDLVNAFQYFDDKNRERISQVKEKLQSQKKSVDDVRSITRFIIKKMDHQLQKKRSRKRRSDHTSQNSKQSSSAPLYNKEYLKHIKLMMSPQKDQKQGQAENEKETQLSMNLQSPTIDNNNNKRQLRLQQNYVFR